MPLFNTKYILFTPCVLTLIVILYVLIFQSHIYLIVKLNDRIIFADEVNVKLPIKYKFIHSSEHTPWIEYWFVSPRGFYLNSICWTSGGAGHPSNTEDFNGNVEIIDNGSYYCAVNVERYIGSSVVVDLGHAYNASITILDKVVECRHDTHCIVELSVRKLNLLEYFLVKLGVLHLILMTNTLASGKVKHDRIGRGVIVE